MLRRIDWNNEIIPFSYIFYNSALNRIQSKFFPKSLGDHFLDIFLPINYSLIVRQAHFNWFKIWNFNFFFNQLINYFLQIFSIEFIFLLNSSNIID